MNWSILGTGRIAERFATQLPGAEQGRLVVIGSRTPDRIPAWADNTPMATYASAVSDTEVEAVYIGLPNGLHLEWTLRALAAGKHVLCEKPLAQHPKEVEQMFAAAKKHERLLVEAFMYRCQPAVDEALTLIREGAIGELKTMRGAFSFEHALLPHDPRWEADLGGGALFDVGCYPVHLMNAIMDAEPLRVESSLDVSSRGVDTSGAALLYYPGKVGGVVTFGMEIGGDRSFKVCGTRGSISFTDPWLHGDEFQWEHEGAVETLVRPSLKGLSALEADAFEAAVRGHVPTWISAEESLRSARTLEAIRKAAR
ncbi:MAG: oxidoreductase [Verrucomicrobiaceae bacterium]|nr:oxidoreductase [Verrucomicrobiaceae bacterium]